MENHRVRKNDVLGKLKVPKTSDDRRLTNKLIDDVLHNSRAFFDSLSPAEKEVALTILNEMQDNTGESLTYDYLWEMHYKEKPVPIWEFLDDPYYAGWLSAETFPKWREVMETVFAPGSKYMESIFCLAGDTKVPLLDGSEKTLKDLYTTYQESKKPFWIYSISQKDGQVVPGECTKVVKFGKDRLYKITLDDGTYFRANADHEMVCRDGIKRKVKNLKTGDKLMPFIVNTHRQSKKGKLYERVYMPGNGKYAYTHRIVGKMLAGGKIPSEIDGDTAVIHHKDKMVSDNTPENLEWLRNTAHIAFHGANKTPQEISRLRERGRKNFLNPESNVRVACKRFMNTAQGRDLAIKNLEKARNLSPEERSERTRKGLVTRWKNPDARKKAGVRCGKRSEGNTWGTANKKEEVTVDDIYESYAELGKLQDVYAELKVSRNRVVRILRDAGLTMEDLGKGYRNHKITKIEEDGLEDVYCLVVPEWKNFAISTSDNRRGVFSGNSGAIGSGKTRTAALMFVYLFYKMSCLKNPPRYYKLLEGSMIVFGIYSVTMAQSADVGYGSVRSIIERIPYFKQKFQHDHRTKRKMVFPGEDMQIIHGSNELHILGKDIYSMYLDEVNFMRDSSTAPNRSADTQVAMGQAAEIYNAARSRIKSRFMRAGGTYPGMTFLISSKTSVNSFLESHIKKIKVDIDEKRTFVADFSQWEVRPKEIYILPKFKVQIGNAIHPSKILEEGMEQAPATETVEVPGEFRKEFTDDPERSLREIAGISTIGVSPLFRDKSPIHDCIDKSMRHPFTREVITISVMSDVELTDYLLTEVIFNIEGGSYVPKINPEAARAVHLDLSLKDDATGVAMGHISGMRQVKKMRLDGTYFMDTEPLIVIDFMLCIKSSSGSQVDYGKIRTLIQSLADYGYPIQVVTADRYQSADTLNMFEKLGWSVKYQSVDVSSEPYLYVKQACIDQRLSYYEYPVFIKEMSNLEFDIDKNKVDHPMGGCWVADTKVNVVGVGEVTMLDLYENYQDKEFEVYSVCNRNILKTTAKNPRLIKTDANIVEVTLSNGHVEKCTPSHLWLTSDGVYVRADKLNRGDVLMSFFSKELVVPGYSNCLAFSYQDGFYKPAYKFDLNNNCLVHQKSLFPLEANGDSMPYDKILATGHTVVSVKKAGKANVYDIHVPILENYALSSGVFVHNSKDVSDAVTGVVYTLMSMKNTIMKKAQVSVSTLYAGDDDGKATVREGALENAYIRDPGSVIIRGDVKINMDVLADEVIKRLEQLKQ